MTEWNLSDKERAGSLLGHGVGIWFVKYHIKEFIRKSKELTKSFIFGDNPPKFCIDEDNIDEYFKELDKLAGEKLV